MVTDEGVYIYIASLLYHLFIVNTQLKVLETEITKKQWISERVKLNQFWILTNPLMYIIWLWILEVRFLLFTVDFLIFCFSFFGYCFRSCWLWDFHVNLTSLLSEILWDMHALVKNFNLDWVADSDVYGIVSGLLCICLWLFLEPLWFLIICMEECLCFV